MESTTKAGEEICAKEELLNEHKNNHIEVLHNINFQIKKGELIGVCGAVGAGKSSLLYGLLGQMNLRDGKVFVNGSCAYVGQQAWILNTTLRDNILLGEAFDAKRYYKVVYACSLTEDIGLLPHGDNTEIGERGINLSGGQKQRLSLARALYCNKDVYLLDDCLSAVDAHVGQHIFQWVFKVALKAKTVIFITHQMQYLPHCDRVIYFQNGSIAEEGKHTYLLGQGRDYSILYKKHIETMKSESSEEGGKPKEFSKIRRDSSSLSSLASQEDSVSSERSRTSIAKTGKEGKLMTEELMEKGNVPYYVYHSYIQYAGGYIISALVILTFLINVGSTAFSSWWLSHWLNAGSGNTTIMVGNETFISENIADNPDVGHYKLVYSLTIFVIMGTSLIRGFAFTKSTLHASSSMHRDVFTKVFRSPMSFFDTTPAGRILNIFSRDFDEVDVRLPFTMEVFLQNIWIIVTSLIFVTMVFPYFLIFLVFLAGIFLFFHHVFSKGILGLKRIENVSRSPLISHVSTTVSGLAYIQAYKKQEMFTKRFMMFFDDNSSSFYLYNAGIRWLALRLDILALSVTSITAILALLLRGSVGAAFAGLALAYSAQLSGVFQYTVRLSTETESRFSSVQRIISYIKTLASEAPVVIESNRPNIKWPKYGRIAFKKVELKYRPETPLILKGVSFDIDSEEKIGIIGRTGSGKSSLGVALFRLVEVHKGSIHIDGINIASIGLDDLRSRLSIIPQDPVLFVGTVRYNLDPFDLYTDNQIWEALEKTSMKETISAFEMKLMSPVVENGENFSVGERQLLCMARALLRNSKILLLDEATAGVDTETDSKIQKTLKEAFEKCTMITIAHRLNTIMSCSRIMIMDNGSIIEFDSPETLLQQPTSNFSKLVEAFKRGVEYI